MPSQRWETKFNMGKRANLGNVHNKVRVVSSKTNMFADKMILQNCCIQWLEFTTLALEWHLFLLVYRYVACEMIHIVSDSTIDHCKSYFHKIKLTNFDRYISIKLNLHMVVAVI